MIDDVCSRPRLNNCCRIKDEGKKSKNDVGFEEIVKFLNAQREVMDYSGLN